MVYCRTGSYKLLYIKTITMSVVFVITKTYIGYIPKAFQFRKALTFIVLHDEKAMHCLYLLCKKLRIFVSVMLHITACGNCPTINNDCSVLYQFQLMVRGEVFKGERIKYPAFSWFP